MSAEAIGSFAGVGYYFHLTDLAEGETVIDLGSDTGSIRLIPKFAILMNCELLQAGRCCTSARRVLGNRTA